MSETTLLVSDASSGTNLAELPWSGMQRSRIRSGAGQLSCVLPIDHPAVTQNNLGQLRSSPDREVTCWRGGFPVWNGAISGTDCTWGDGVFNLVAREFPWYLGKRVNEVDKTYTPADVFNLFRDLLTSMTSKTATGADGMSAGADIIAAIPRLSVNPASATAGVTMSASFAGAARHTYQECLDYAMADPTAGFEFRTAYTGTTWRTCQRVFVLGQPNVGSVLTRPLTQLNAATYGRSGDWERGATRSHVVGAGYTKTLQSATAVSNSVLLLETVDDFTNTSDHGLIDARAKDLRRMSQPPVRAFTWAYIPDDVLAYGAIDIGDTCPFGITSPSVLSVTGTTRRVVQEDVACDVDGSELVTLTFNDPLTDLGT